MANVIKPKRSNTASNVPTTANLSSGELAVNMADKKVYINNGTAVVQVGAGNLTGLGDVVITTPTNGQSLTFNGTNWINQAGAGSGTVTSVSVVSANGFAGTVATATSTPAITLTTSITGLIKGNGTALSSATSGTDYSYGTSALATGIVKSTTTTGALTIAVAGDFPTLNQNTTGSSASCTGNSATATTAGNVTGTVAISNGGTGAITAPLALTALGAYPATNPNGYTSNTGTVTGVTATSPVASSGGTAPVISMPAATSLVSGYLTNTDWATFNGKQAALGFTPYNSTNPAGYTSNTGTVTSVGGTGTVSGLTLTGTVTGSGNLTLGGAITGFATGTGSATGTNTGDQTNVTGSSGSCTGNAATATNAQTQTFYTQPNTTWGARVQLGGNGGGSGVATTCTVQATDGNIHIDAGLGKGMYLNYYQNGIIYLNGTTYSISSNGSYYNGTSASCSGNAATATTASGVSAGVVAGKMVYDTFTATAAQTTFTNSVTYTSGKIEVYVNGCKMRNGTDVTVTSGTSVVFASGLAVGSLVDLVYPT